MDAIVNVSPDWGIGFESHLLVSIRADLQRFRMLTEGKTVIFGRKTLETFPGGKPLKNRRNLILSADPNFSVDGAQCCHSLPDLFAYLQDEPNICVIGGASIYRALLPYCSRAFVTKSFLEKESDCFFPNLDACPQWTQTAASEVYEENGIKFQYIDYANQSPLPFPEKNIANK